MSNFKTFGPVLYADTITQETATFRILYAAAVKPMLYVEQATSQDVVAINSLEGLTFWSLRFVLPREAVSRRIQYHIDSKAYAFTLKGLSQQNTRVAFASCNGSEADRPHQPIWPGRNTMWEDVHLNHQSNPFYLLIHGGDQIYADGVWHEITFLKNWLQRPREEQYIAPLPADAATEIRKYYFECYMHQWSQIHMRDVLACVPNAMMWDDHDIFDGWGSWNASYQDCPVYKAVFAIAREAFMLFQRGLSVDATATHLGFDLAYDQLVVIAPDLRSQRSRKRVMAEDQWTWLHNAFDRYAGRPYVLLASSVPLATSHFSALDPILTGFPSFLARRLPNWLNPKRFADDIHDQWRVKDHREEWHSMLNLLLQRVQGAGQKIAVVSGEIHLGARSTIRRGNAEVMQYIASAIAHKPAHPAVAWACEMLSKDRQDIKGDIDIRIEKFFDKGIKRYLRARNWLSLDIDEAGVFDAVWHAENTPAVTHRW